jgi:hypothetical protein
MTYDPHLPFGGLGSECGNLELQRRRDELHAQDPRIPAGVFIEFYELADCRECDMCGGCETHQGCVYKPSHIEWRMLFASPGELECGAQGIVDGRWYVCGKIAGHGGRWHQCRRGRWWAV